MFRWSAPGRKCENESMDQNETEDPPIKEENPFAKYAGILPAFPGGIKEINAWVRSLRDDDESTVEDASS
jgi:hypothetical protein